MSFSFSTGKLKYRLIHFLLFCQTGVRLPPAIILKAIDSNYFSINNKRLCHTGFARALNKIKNPIFSFMTSEDQRGLKNFCLSRYFDYIEKKNSEILYNAINS